MIEAIEVQGIQSYTKKTKITLHPGVNVFLGESDAGKSALASRTLYWVSHNAGLGAGSLNSSLAMVRVHIKDGEDRRIIERVRTKSENYYRVRKKGEWSEKYKNLKSGIPQEVSEALGLCDLNYHHQMEPPFLMMCKSGERAEQLNDIVDLQMITTSTQAANSDKLSIDGAVRAEKAKLKASQDSLAAFAGLDEAEGKLAGLEQLEGQIAGMKIKKSRLASILEEIKSAEESQEQFAALSATEASLVALEELSASIKDNRKKKGLLSSILVGVKQSESELERMSGLPEAVVKLEELESGQTALSKLHTVKKRLDSLLGSIKKSEENLVVIKTRLDKQEKEFHELMPDECPLCGSAV